MGTAGGTDARRLPLPGTENVRDLGGLPAAGGARTAPGRLLRGEVLCATASPGVACYDPAQADRFRALGLATVIDLRQPGEAAAIPSVWADATGAELVACPFGDGADGVGTSLMERLGSGELRRFTVAQMVDLYLDWMTRQATAVVQVVRLLTTPSRLPALVHCAAGKDRTGIVVAVVLSALGVPEDVVVADYELTQALRPGRTERAARWLSSVGVDVDEVRVLFESPGEVMAGTLAAVDERWGSTAGYLTDAGTTDDELSALRRALLVPGPVSPPAP